MLRKEAKRYLRGQEMKHDIRMSHTWSATGKATRFKVGRSARTCLVVEPLETHLNHPGELLVLEERYGFLAFLHHIHFYMILKVFPDSWNMSYDRYAKLFQLISVANA